MPTDMSPARTLMDHFAASTGLATTGLATTGLATTDTPPRRYLWTDAFAVCNWLGLGEVERARELAGQVHEMLGRHRSDDPREGWISGLPEEEGVRHPTAGGLRIGKPLPERRPNEPYDPRLEWERDGQYFHYLTRWMRALQRLSEATGEDRYHAWAVELARVAFDGFSHGIGPVPNRLHWKMSIDLSRPLVPSMGQHDPLDGYVAMSEIRGSRPGTGAEGGGEKDGAADLEDRMGLLAGMGEGGDWTTDDPLGAGSLLTDAWFLASIEVRQREQTRLLEQVLGAATLSVREVRDLRVLELPASRRLAFRELGLAIGLGAVERLAALDLAAALDADADRQVEEMREAVPLRSAIINFWLEPENRQATTWLEHEDINTVMLATAIRPDGYLGAGATG